MSTSTAASDEKSRQVRTRLIAFFRKYAPQDLYKVETLLPQAVDNEAAVFDDLRKKYKVAETNSSPSALDGDADGLRKRLTQFYAKYAPTETGKVENAMQMNLPESKLFQALYTKYKVPPADQTFHTNDTATARATRSASMTRGSPSTAQAAPLVTALPEAEKERVRARVEAFYRQAIPNDPTVASKVQVAMTMAATEAQLFEKLYQKYNFTSDGKPREVIAAAPPPGVVLEEAPERAALRKRLMTFYQEHNPNEVELKVENAMSMNVPEDELFSALYRKYNITMPPPSLPAATTDAPATPSAVTSPAEPVVVNEALRERLFQFYRQYAPDLSPAETEVKVNGALQMKIPESLLFEKLHEKYGVQSSMSPSSGGAVTPTPSQTRQDNTDAVVDERLRKRLIDFYNIHAPSEVESKVAIALSLKVPEDMLFAKLHEKYGLPPPPQNDGTANGSPEPGAVSSSPPAPENAFGSSPAHDDVDIEALRERVKAFFNRFEPGNPQNEERVRDSVDVVASGHMTERELISFIEQQYGPAMELRMVDNRALPPVAVGVAGSPNATTNTGSVVTSNPAPESETSNLTNFSQAQSPAPRTPTAEQSDSARAAPAATALPPPPTLDTIKASPPPITAVAAAATARNAFRDRLVKFYTDVGASDVETKVAYALQIEAPEDEIMTHIQNKYLPPPTLDAEPAAGKPLVRDRENQERLRKEKLRERLIQFYKKHNPENLNKVDVALTLDIPEETLFAKLYEKYGLDERGQRIVAPSSALNRFDDASTILVHQRSAIPQPQPQPQPQSERDEEDRSRILRRREVEDRLFVLLAANVPASEASFRAKAASLTAQPNETVDETVSRCAREWFLAQEQKPQDSKDAELTTTGSSTPSASVKRGEDMKARLTAFYEAVNPREVAQVESVLLSDLSDAEIWQRLSDRYGEAAVEPYVPAASTTRGSSLIPDAKLSQRASSTLLSASMGKRSQAPSSVPTAERAALMEQLVEEAVAADPLDEVARVLNTSIDEKQRSFPSQSYVIASPVSQRDMTQRIVSAASQAAPTQRAVSMLVKLPEVSMYLVKTTHTLMRTSFYDALEKDTRTFAVTHGAVGVVAVTSYDPSSDDMLCMQYLAVFPTPVAAHSFIHAVTADTSMPAPSTRAAYSLMGGNIHAVHDATIAFATLTDVPSGFTPNEVTEVVHRASSGVSTVGQRSTTTAAVRTDASLSSPVATPKLSSAPTAPLNTATKPLEKSMSPPSNNADYYTDVSRGGSVTSALRSRHHPQMGADISDATWDARLGGQAVPSRNHNSAAKQTLSWGEVTSLISSAEGLPQSSSTAYPPPHLRHEALDTREATIRAKELEINERMRLVEQREATCASRETADASLVRRGEQQRDRQAQVATQFETLSVREMELREYERRLVRREEQVSERERLIESKLSDVNHRLALAEERERRVELRERQVREDEEEKMKSGPSSSGWNDAAYVNSLEQKLREAQARLIEGDANRMISASAAHVSPPANHVDARLRHVIEREALVAESEARLERQSLTSVSEVRQRDEALRRRWEDLRTQDRELVTRRLEVEAANESIQRSRAEIQATMSSPVHYQHQQQQAAAGRRSSTPQRDAAPLPMTSVGSPGIMRQDDVTAMLRRVKEREQMLRNISETIKPVRGHMIV